MADNLEIWDVPLWNCLIVIWQDGQTGRWNLSTGRLWTMEGPWRAQSVSDGLWWSHVSRHCLAKLGQLPSLPPPPLEYLGQYSKLSSVSPPSLPPSLPAKCGPDKLKSLALSPLIVYCLFFSRPGIELDFSFEDLNKARIYLKRSWQDWNNKNHYKRDK